MSRSTHVWQWRIPPLWFGIGESDICHAHINTALYRLLSNRECCNMDVLKTNINSHLGNLLCTIPDQAKNSWGGTPKKNHSVLCSVYILFCFCFFFISKSAYFFQTTKDSLHSYVFKIVITIIFPSDEHNSST